VTPVAVGKYSGYKSRHRFSPILQIYRVVIERKELTVVVS